MTFLAHDLSVVVDGKEFAPDLAGENPLVRAVLISLFTWRRANDDDVLPTPDSSRMGWWGDGLATVKQDKIGSRLWLLSREKLIPQTFERAQEYAREALTWLIADGLADQVTVSASRFGLSGLRLDVTITRAGQALLTLSFNDVWKVING